MSRDVSGDYSRLVLGKGDPDNPSEERLKKVQSIRDRFDALLGEISECSKEAPELTLPLTELKAAQARIVEALEAWQVR